MRLLLLDQFSDLGGAQQALLELLPELRRRGWQALVGLPGEGEMFARVCECGFPVERIACGPYRSGRKSLADAGRFLWQTPMLRLQIRRLAGRFRPDLIYINGPRLLPAAPAGWPVVFHAHSFVAPGAVRDLAGRALRRLRAHVIANCAFVAGAWRGHVPPHRISIVYNGVIGPSTPPQPRPAAPHPVVACVGRIAPEKGQREFLDAAELIHRDLPRARFQIVGAPLFGDAASLRYDASLRAAAAHLAVEFPGWIDDVYHALAAIDLLLVPSAPHEATTRVILEAYSAGVPVVALRSGGVPEVIEPDAGCLAATPAEMAHHAIELLRNPARRAGMSRAARGSWERRFTLDRFRRELVALLEHPATAGIPPPTLPPAPPLPPASIRTPPG